MTQLGINCYLLLWRYTEVKYEQLLVLCLTQPKIIVIELEMTLLRLTSALNMWEIRAKLKYLFTFYNYAVLNGFTSIIVLGVTIDALLEKK